MEHSKRSRNSEACCRNESKMVRCAVTAMEKMRNYLLETSVCQDIENSSPQGDYDCTINCNKYTTEECPFRGTGMPPNVSNIQSNKKPHDNLQIVNTLCDIKYHLL
jgi:hypothetical protein